ncbi:heme-thiolate peroxidase [Leucocoprinus birnbaumii]|uniref:Heme-thiolate peroxidase n=1 Tax=Leucocoprinus birnbaumii TaxID=56174 RepID=A0AAD5YW30_9AGAR|nr:heme-thiolate peroxidase [Leucocoprinus birnbaumii]
MVKPALFTTLALTLVSSTSAFPAYASLAGLSQAELDRIIPTLDAREPAKLPPPMKSNGTKLVNDAQHPFKPLRPGDIRGPCPGMNTLASHGYIPRTGVASPSQIIEAVGEGFNMERNFATFITYLAHLSDGNQVTDLLSIGGKTSKTGPVGQYSKAPIGGFDFHNTFEGDASLSRGDSFFGDNHTFNETIFQEFIDFSNKFGAGKYNLTVAGELRFHRIQQSIATNPQMTFLSPRYTNAYSESAFPINFFVDGRHYNGQLDTTAARSFFQNMRMPDGFHRAPAPIGGEGFMQIGAAHPLKSGRNVKGVNSYKADPSQPKLGEFCKIYEDFVKNIVVTFYPKPTGDLKKALNINLGRLYDALTVVNGSKCPRLFPFGK